MGRVQISCLGSMGRFGNQLFQYAFARGFADSHMAELETPPNWQGRQLFGLNDKPLGTPLPKTPIEEIPKGPGTDLQGYFQTQKAFDAYGAERAREWFRFDPRVVEQIIGRPFKRPSGFYVAAHLRRGDYTQEYFRNKFCIVSKESYLRAMARFGIDPDEVVWVGEDSGRSWLEDFLLLQHADVLFRANSSFSWWASLLGGMPTFAPVVDRRVGDCHVEFAPGNWPRSADASNGHVPLTDIFLPCEREWSQTSFVIRLRIDSPERLRNLQTVVQRLNQLRGSETIVVEMDKTPKALEALRHCPCRYIFVEDHDPVFHLTRAQNIGMRASDRQVLVIQDADVLIPSCQYHRAINAILSREADFAYPYDGEFIMLDERRSWDARDGRIDADGLKRDVGKSNGTGSFGGVVAFRRDVFMTHGMENENLTGWGFDDWERHERFTKFGKKFIRSDGPLFHLWHPSTSNSRDTSSPECKANKFEFERVKRMKAPDLRAYIQQWPWLRGGVVSGTGLRYPVKGATPVAKPPPPAAKPPPTPVPVRQAAPAPAAEAPRSPDAVGTWTVTAPSGVYVWEIDVAGGCRCMFNGKPNNCGTWRMDNGQVQLCWRNRTQETFNPATGAGRSHAGAKLAVRREQ